MGETEFIDKLVNELTLDEKLSMIHGAAMFHTEAVERLGIPELVMSDGPMGVRNDFEDDKWIPIGNSDDYVSYMPSNSALAATWNRELAHSAGNVLGSEARGRGKDVILAPGVNLKRSPLCGRNFEYFSEDGFLTSELAIPFIKGVQENDVAACVKHFALNHQETERLWVDEEIDEEVLRDTYLYVFEEILKRSGSYSIMSAYNKLYGEQCCESKFLLNKVLREEWNYDGCVISDWGGVHNTKNAAEASLDIEMSVTNNFDEYFLAKPLKKAIEAGEVDEKLIDEKVRHILLLMLRLKMIGAGEEKPSRKKGAYNTEKNRQSIYDVASESIILLKNDKKLLPLDESKLKRILVIGENAERLHSNGGGSAEIKALYEISPLMGIRKKLGGNVKVDYVKGYASPPEENTNNGTNWQEKSLESMIMAPEMDGVGDDKYAMELAVLKSEAKKAAADGKYDAVIFVGGLNHEYDIEGRDRKSMKLPYSQDILIKELLSVRQDMIVVMMAGSAVEMGTWKDDADTLIWEYYNGMEGGTALSDVIFGDVNPSGRLPETLYYKVEDCSAFALGDFGGKEKVHYREGRLIGYRYTEKENVPVQFKFGYGLSYTEFETKDAEVSKDNSKVTLKVKNIGKYDGKETVQVYADNGEYKTLCGFEKVFLKSGEEKSVSIEIPERYRSAKTISVGNL
ncbi:MAG: glycoside hydrolase family 3 C-terminal domain-containing protein [Lachnospiraceae bacterium]|nr:glycoside hydrolase family 3 C-terminal domain-containing protein [Lachnospiraceae bacterium]